VLYHAPRTRDPRSAVLRLLDRKTGKVSTVLEDASHGTPLGDSLLLFMRGTALMAVRFNAKAGTTAGEPVTVEADIASASSMPITSGDSRMGQYAVSAHGDLVIARGGFYPRRLSVLVTRTPSGALRRLPLPSAEYWFVRGSPTGDRLAVAATDVTRGFGTTTSVFDMTRELLTPVTSTSLFNDRPVWSADGRQLAIEVDGAEGRDLAILSTDGVTPPRRLAIPYGVQRTVAWLPDGRVALTAAFPGGMGLGVWSPDGTVRRLLAIDSIGTTYQTFSPDYRRIAYVKERQVFVRPFPGPGSAVAVSDIGATQPAWAPNGNELYFIVPRDSTSGAKRALMVAALSGDAPMRVSRPRVVMTDFPAVGGTPLRSWDVLHDGSLAMIVPADTTPLADVNRAAIREIHVAQRALRGLRLGDARSPTPTSTRPK
jgi:serine/threonine-protein kinase